MKKYCVSLELAKEMKKLGFEQVSEFYWFYSEQEEKYKLVKKGYICDWKESYSAYTVGELGDMLPKWAYSYKKNKRWICEESDCQQLELTLSNTEADARAKMLIYLKKEGII